MRKSSWRTPVLLLMAGIAGFGKAETGKAPLGAGFLAGRPGTQRDPFRSPEAASDAPRPPGLAGLAVTETVVRGIVRYPIPVQGEDETDASAWAILESPSGEGFVAAPGDRLFDGVVGLIEEDGVVFWLGGDPDRHVFRPLARLAADAREGV